MKILVLGGSGMLGHRLWINLRQEHRGLGHRTWRAQSFSPRA